MAYTALDICKIVAVKLGAQESVTSITAPTNPFEEKLALVYTAIKEDLLKLYPWNFAIKRATLTVSETTPLFEYDYQYTLPTDYLQTIRINEDSENTIDYRIEGGYLLTDEDAVNLEYIYKASESVFTSDFVMTLVLKIAHELCFSINNNLQKEAQLRQAFLYQLMRAQNNDSKENKLVRTSKENEWIVERY